MGVVNFNIKIMLFALALLLIPAFASAQPPQFSETYDEDFVEGEDLTISLGELDILKFTYYGENHSFRVLGIYEDSALIRADNKALELLVGATHKFDFDEDDANDFSVNLRRTRDLAKFDLELYEHDDGSDDDEENTTNTTQTNTTNTTTSNSTNTNTSAINTTNQHTANNTQQQTSQNNQTTGDKSSPTGGTVINININFPEGSGIGLLIMIAIVLGGLLVYKKLRTRIGD